MEDDWVHFEHMSQKHEHQIQTYTLTRHRCVMSVLDIEMCRTPRHLHSTLKTVHCRGKASNCVLYLCLPYVFFVKLKELTTIRFLTV